MGFRNNAYATVWESKPGKGNYNDIKLQISKKKQNGEYETEFSGWVRFVGEAKNLGLMAEKTRIQIRSCDITNYYNKEKNQMFWNPVVFEADIVDGNRSAKPTNPDDFMTIPDGISEEIPFC